MKYSVNLSSYKKVFAVPAALVEDDIRLAGAIQIKVLLWMYFHTAQSADAEEIAQSLGLAAADVRDAMQYWLMKGLICEAGVQPEPVSQPSDEERPQVAAPPAEVHAKTTVVPTPAKPSREELSRRGDENPEISWMMSEAQQRFGRTLSYGEMSTLVWLYDTQGLPAAVILMIIEYSLSMEKCNIRYIEKVDMNWAQQEIDTVEKAESLLVQSEKGRRAWGKIESAFGIDHRQPSEKEREYASRWITEWKFSQEMLRLAYDQCVDNTAKLSLPYINKILEKWHKLSLKSCREVQEYNAGKSSAAEKKNAAARSYDIDKIEQAIKEGRMT